MFFTCRFALKFRILNEVTTPSEMHLRLGNTWYSSAWKYSSSSSVFLLHRIWDLKFEFQVGIPICQNLTARETPPQSTHCSQSEWGNSVPGHRCRPVSMRLCFERHVLPSGRALFYMHNRFPSSSRGRRAGVERDPVSVHFEF